MMSAYPPMFWQDGGELRRDERGEIRVGTVIVDSHAVVESLFWEFILGVLEDGGYEWGIWEFDRRRGDRYSGTECLGGFEQIRKGSRDSYEMCKFLRLLSNSE